MRVIRRDDAALLCPRLERILHSKVGVVGEVVPSEAQFCACAAVAYLALQ